MITTLENFEFNAYMFQNQKMIKWTRNARIQPGKFEPAMQFAKELSEITKHHEGVTSFDVHFDQSGGMGSIIWSAMYKDLDTLEEIQHKMINDRNYRQKIDEAKDLFIDTIAWP